MNTESLACDFGGAKVAEAAKAVAKTGLLPSSKHRSFFISSFSTRTTRLTMCTPAEGWASLRSIAACYPMMIEYS